MPDILCVAKGLSGGYLPLAATLTIETIFKAFLGTFEERRTFFHGHTYTENPLACAAGLARLRLFEEQNLLAQLPQKASYLQTKLDKKLKDAANVGDIRQCGLMLGIELVASRASKEPYPARMRVGHQVILAARRRGIILRPLGGCHRAHATFSHLL